MPQSEVDPVAATQMFCKGWAIPRARSKTKIARGLAQVCLQAPPLNGIERARAPRTRSVVQPIEAVCLESSHPSLHGACALTKPLRNLRARAARSDQQQGVKAMVVAGCFIAVDFPADCRLHQLGTFDLFLAHDDSLGDARMLPQKNTELVDLDAAMLRFFKKVATDLVANA